MRRLLFTVLSVFLAQPTLSAQRERFEVLAPEAIPPPEATAVKQPGNLRVASAAVAPPKTSEKDVTGFPTYCFKHPEDKGSSRRSPKLSDTFLKRNPELIQVQALVRHGDRTPFDPHTTNCWPGWNPQPRADLEYVMSAKAIPGFKSVGIREFTVQDVMRAPRIFDGQLTRFGAAQAKAVGEFLAQSYLMRDSPYKIPQQGTPSLISAASDMELKQQMELRATGITRTQLTAASLISQFLQSGGLGHLGTPDLQVGHPTTEIFVENFNRPEVKSIWTDLVYRQKCYDAAMKKHADTVKLIEDSFQLKLNISDPTFPTTTLDCWYYPICNPHEYTLLPEHLRPPTVDPKLLAAIDSWLNDVSAALRTFDNRVLSRISADGAVRLIRGRAAAAAKGEGPRFVLWSTHDSTVMVILASMGGNVWGETIPEFVATSLFEFYKTPDDGKLFFRIIINGEDRTKLFPSCTDSPCPLQTFFNETSWADLRPDEIRLLLQKPPPRPIDS